MTKTITKKETSNPDLLFIGYDGYEEYYQEKSKKGGWSLMGLRPATETELRERQRDTDIREFCTIPDFLLPYIDEDKFANDMEENWEEHHDVQATRENEEGETLYLGFGSGQSVGSYFKSNNITDYESYCNHFEEIGLTKKQFDNLLKKYGNS